MNKKLLFVCPFPYGIQGGQRLKFEQHFHKFREANYVIFESSLIWSIVMLSISSII